MPFRIISVRVRWVFGVMAFFLLTMTLFRLVFFWRYQPSETEFIIKAFFLGLRYDLKFTAIAGILIFLCSLLPPLDPFRRNSGRLIWNIMIPLFWVIMIFIYVADFFHFDYLQQRLNASVLNYLEDTSISAGMVLQSYPVIPISAAILSAAWLGRIMFGRLLGYFLKRNNSAGRRWIGDLLFLMVSGILVFGKWSQYPLRWSDAFAIGNNFSANLALNPLQSFFSTLRFRENAPDINKVKDYYPLMAEYLGVNDKNRDRLNFTRTFKFDDSSSVRPNIVLVICESFSSYKTGIFGNPLQTTPYFDSLAPKGVFFDRCFTPAYGTARGVWAVITGIPDVENPKTASRNPAAVNQRTIINDFKEYEHLYFIGGNPSWANIQGLLSNNIKDLRMYMQYDFPAPKVDVWGISDKNLFLEANKVLRNEKKPFFAIIQTADNHRPYTIPEEDKPYLDLKPLPADSLKSFGFESNEELFAFRYTDYCFRIFMETVKKEAFFDNTIFVFVGDHGIPGNARNIFPESWTEHTLTREHVPLLFYAPALLTPARYSRVCSQLDVLPSAAGLARIPFQNHTLGRNLFDSASQVPPSAFIMDHELQQIGTVSNDLYYMYNLKSGKENIVSLLKDNRLRPGSDAEKIKLKELTLAMYETARYMLFNNKKP